jgi:hypothetical protein
VPRWSRAFKLDGKPVTAENGWYAVDAPAGASAWSLAFDMSARTENIPPEAKGPAVAANARLDIMQYTVHFMEWYTPDMANLSRHDPAMLVFRGPLVLAKGRLAGTSRDETLNASSLRGYGWKASLAPAPVTPCERRRTAALGAHAHPWTRVEDDSLSDFASVSNVDDPSNWFSLWF